MRQGAIRDETILCVPSALPMLRGLDGFHAASPEDLEALFDPRHAWFGPRCALEEDPSFRQLIPYVIVSHGRSIAYYRRGPRGQEERLRGLLSIGFGGHVSLADVAVAGGGLDVRRTLENAALRELSEEVRAAPILSKSTLGVLCDSAAAVSRVHLGIVELWRTEAPDVRTNESDIHECGFADVRALSARAEEMEDWSRLSLERVEPLLLGDAPPKRQPQPEVR